MFDLPMARSERTPDVADPQPAHFARPPADSAPRRVTVLDTNGVRLCLALAAVLCAWWIGVRPADTGEIDAARRAVQRADTSKLSQFDARLQPGQTTLIELMLLRRTLLP
jgi:hypothetical protein